MMGTARDSPDLQKQFVQRQETIRRQSSEVEKAIRQVCGIAFNSPNLNFTSTTDSRVSQLLVLYPSLLSPTIRHQPLNFLAVSSSIYPLQYHASSWGN